MRTLEDSVAHELQHPRHDVGGDDPEEEGVLVHAGEDLLPEQRQCGLQEGHAHLSGRSRTAKLILMEA